MPRIAGSAFRFAATRRFQAQLDDELQTLVKALQGLVISSATQIKFDEQGKRYYTIPMSSEQSVLAQAGDLVQRFFVGADLRSPFAKDGVTPLAPYPRILMDWLGWVTWQVVAKHSEYMRKHLPADVQRWMLQRLSREQQTNPLAIYDAPHLWLDPKGHRLSDRIWGAGIETRRKIDAFLSEGIRSGRGALDLSKDLEPFLLPSKRGLITTKPYGSKASTYAMTLARTEISRAHSTAAHVSALANPFVDGWEWMLTIAHPRIDQCDDLATIGIGGNRLKEPYPLDGSEPVVVVDSHPNCTCVNYSSISRSSADVIGELRDIMSEGEVAPITPIDTFSFVKRLLGGTLASLVFKQIVRKVSL